MNPTKRYSSGVFLIGALFIAAVLTGGPAPDVYAGPPIFKCKVNPTNSCGSTRSEQPRCAMELTCYDRYVKLGNPDGVCFRPTCPGIWALVHRCTDQNSFRRRFITYRHYTFVGYWRLKDQGIIETGSRPTRELFLVMPDDLIEIKMTLPDCYARTEVKNLGYIKKGSKCELEKWLAEQMYLNSPALAASYRSRSERRLGPPGCPPPGPAGGLWGACYNGLQTMSRGLGLPYP